MSNNKNGNVPGNSVLSFYGMVPFLLFAYEEDISAVFKLRILHGRPIDCSRIGEQRKRVGETVGMPPSQWSDCPDEAE